MVTLALGLALDQEQFDKGSDASRARVKLECLKFVQDVRMDGRKAPDGDAPEASFQVWVSGQNRKRLSS